MFEAPIPEILKVDFSEVNAGWLTYKLQIGEQTFEDSFSECYDPIPDLKHWLEAIAIGAQQTSFVYDNEGQEIKFDFNNITHFKSVITISENRTKRPFYIQANIDRKQIVESFYNSFNNFIKSDKWFAREWEHEYISEKLCKDLNLNKASLIEELITLKENELSDLLFAVVPCHSYSYPKLKNNFKSITAFAKAITDDKNPIDNNPKWIATEVRQKFPKNYDFQSVEQKKEFIIDCIEETTGSFNASKTSDFKSKIIEKFLKDK